MAWTGSICGKRSALYRLFPAAALLLSACGWNDDSELSVVAIGEPAAPFRQGSRLSVVGQAVRQATSEGLVAFDEQGRVVPALADRWIVTEDGLSYIFRLRDGTWPGGEELTAAAARAALIRARDSVRGTPLGLDLSAISEIRTMAGRVIEVRLSRPMPDLLQVLAQPELGMTWKGQGAGPMSLRREGDTAVLVPIKPERRGLPAIADWSERTRLLKVTAMSAPRAVEAFNAGEADLLLGGQIQDFPLASALGISRGTIQLDPAVGLFGLGVVRASGLLGEPAGREALAMAIDRTALIAAFGVSGWAPTTRLVAPGLPGDPGMVGERWSGMTIEARRAEAARRVARLRAGGAGAVRISIALPKGPGADILFARLRGDLGQIGVTLVRAADGQAADLRLVDLVARYPRAEWFLNQFACAARRGLCSQAADQRMAEARAAPHPAARAAILAEAEAELTRANVYVPLGQPIRWSLARASVTGFAPNRWSVHPLMPLAMRPR